MRPPQEGDVVRFRKCTTTYDVVIDRDISNKLVLQNKGTNNRYPMPTDPRTNLVLVSIKGAHARARIIKHPWDTSGFDALHSAGKNDAVDALSYAAQAMADYNKKDVIMTDKMMRHAKTYGVDIQLMRDIASKLNNKEDKMSISINGLVAKNTNNIEDAQLVTKYFGHELNENSIKDELFVQENYKELLKRAKAKKAEADRLLEKSCA